MDTEATTDTEVVEISAEDLETIETPEPAEEMEPEMIEAPAPEAELVLAELILPEADELDLALAAVTPEPEAIQPLTAPEPVKAFKPTVTTECGDVYWSHPTFVGGFGAPTEYLVYVNGGPAEAYTPGTPIKVADGGAAWNVTLKAKYATKTFEHQLGQHKGVGVVCEVATPPLECPADKVPGWLDENGNPQGCVDNNPTPGKPKDEPATPTAPETPTDPATPVETVAEVGATPAPVDELAHTGGDLVGGALLGLAVAAAGIALIVRGKLAARAAK